MTTKNFLRPVMLAIVVASTGTCGVNVETGPYPYNDPWYYNNVGTYTLVRRPIVVVDGWTSRAFRARPYRGFVLSRHNSPVTVYKATKGEQVLEVDLTPKGDVTQVEVRARNGGQAVDQQQAQALLRQILAEYR